MSGRSRQGAPDRSTQKMPLRTRRSSTRGLPRDFVGNTNDAPLVIGKLVTHDCLQAEPRAFCSTLNEMFDSDMGDGERTRLERKAYRLIDSILVSVTGHMTWPKLQEVAPLASAAGVASLPAHWRRAAFRHRAREEVGGRCRAASGR
jgi:hypothetical protein